MAFVGMNNRNRSDEVAYFTNAIMEPIGYYNPLKEKNNYGKGLCGHES